MLDRAAIAEGDAYRAACIDVGTNSIKILVADLTNNEAKQVFELSAVTRLGESMNASHGLLLDIPMQRTLDGLSNLIEAASVYGVNRIACVGTAALRDASNSKEFVQRAKETLGINIEIISGDEEARLSFLAVRRDPNWREIPHIRVIDVGGGSTEIIEGISDSNRIDSRYSLNLGAVKLTERFLTSDPPSVDQLAAANDSLMAEFARIALPVAPSGSVIPTVVGVGGTLTTLAAMCIGGVKDPLKIHGYRLRAEDLELHISRLSTLTIAARKDIPGLDPRRADIILGGAMVVSSVLKNIGAAYLDVSTRGLRWGVLYDRYFTMSH